MLKAGWHLVRYADDFIVMCDSIKSAHDAYTFATTLLNAIDLELHPLTPPNSKSKVVDIASQSIEFLSICFDGKDMWPNDAKLESLLENIREVTEKAEREEEDTVINILQKVRWRLDGWLAAFCFVDCDRHFSKIDEEINIRIAYALKRLDWRLKEWDIADKRLPKLGSSQRINSGIPNCKYRVKYLRKGL